MNQMYDYGTLDDLKDRMKEMEIQNSDQFHEETSFLAYEKLTEDQVIEISRKNDLFQKSPNSYDSANNKPIMKILRGKIRSKLRRELNREEVIQG